MAIDFIVYQLQRIADQEFPGVPGVLVERAGKNAHRHRQSDVFAIQIVTEGSTHFSGEELQNLLSDASEIFYRTQGSVTRAMQSVIDRVNKEFYDKNSEWGYEGKQALGSVNVCVYHNDWIFIGQAGDAFVYHIGENSYALYGESSESQDKLGVSRRIQVRFFQCGITAGDLLLMSPKAHGSWKSYYLAKSHALPISQLKRRLHNQMIQDFSVVVLKSEAGTGRVREGNWLAAEKADETERGEVGQRAELPEDADHKRKEDKTFQEDETSSVLIETKKRQETAEPAYSDAVGKDGQDTLSIIEGETETTSSTSVMQKAGSQSADSQPSDLIKFIARTWMRGKTFRAKMQLSLSRIYRKIFPGKSTVAGRPRTLQALITFILPAILTIGSLFIFTNSGKDEQYNAFMDLAYEKSTAAETVASAAEQKTLWVDVLDLVIKAEDYRVTNESRQLFTRAQSIIDKMELTSRLNFRPAMTQPFPESARISTIKDSSSGTYLLDMTTGNVLRVFVNSKGFLELDEEFVCQPRDYGLVDMGNIVDFVVLPANNMGYKILAVDADGDVLYCQPGKQPVSRTLTVPEGGWGEISHAIYVQDRLLILDAAKNAIWVYETSDEAERDLAGIVFVESPISFFDEDNPDIGGAIGAVINQEDLYILHEDGHMTLCQYGYEGVRQTECTDPAAFTDNRTSSENKKPWIFLGTNFIRMDQAMFPQPSIYLLDKNSGTIFQFSMQLNLENTLKPQINRDFPLPESEPTGFGILLDQEVLLAFNNSLYTAPLK